jgi:predicted nucleic acid-binding protein
MTNAYFDTSAIVPLIIEEQVSEKARAIWRDAKRVASARVVYAEGHAALAAAVRLVRLRADRLRAAVKDLLDRYQELYIISSLVVSGLVPEGLDRLVKWCEFC